MDSLPHLIFGLLALAALWVGTSEEPHHTAGGQRAHLEAPAHRAGIQ